MSATTNGRDHDHRDHSAGYEITYLRLGDLRPDPKNPRVHSPRQIRQLAASIKAFRFNVPILVDRNLKVIAGHGRILAAQELGLVEVPVIRLEHLTEAQAQAFMIADNRLTENSVWDDRLLAEQLKTLSEIDLDFDLEATGFEMGEIDLRIEGLDDDSEKSEVIEEVPEKKTEPVSRPGDLWILGRHSLYCGSALDRSAYATVMGGRKAAMVFTDPPYNVPIVGNVSGNAQHREFAMGTGEMTAAEFTAFLNTTCSMLARFSVDGSLHFICMDWRHIEELMNGTRGVYSELKNLCVWVKNNAGMGPSTAASTSSSSCSRTEPAPIGTMSSWVSSDVTARTYGPIPARRPSRARARKETCSKNIPP